jgi:Prolyl-tRNA synthetase
VSTPGVSSVNDVAKFLNINPRQLVKTLLYVNDGAPVAVLVRGDHEVNEAKLQRVLRSRQLVMADAETIKKVTGGPLGFSGPAGLSGVRIVADHAVRGVRQAVIGANKADAHFINAGYDRDFPVSQWADVRTITVDDACPRCGGAVELCQAIEVGHVFKLGTKYTDALQATFLDEQGKAQKVIMGCYGIGVTRIIAACIEQNYDANGIVWPEEITPFQVLLMPLNPEDERSRTVSRQLYAQLRELNIEVLFDDRNIRAGIKFKDADLVGIPYQIVIGEKNLVQNCVEIKIRRSGERQTIPWEQAVSRVNQLLNKT